MGIWRKLKNAKRCISNKCNGKNQTHNPFGNVAMYIYISLPHCQGWVSAKLPSPLAHFPLEFIEACNH
jgi:hypothetical protein